MGWASHYIEELKKGNKVSFKPIGNSMSGIIESGQLVTVEPGEGVNIVKGDVVLCKVKGKVYLHLVGAVNGNRYQICNARGFINGWISKESIFGKKVKQ